MNPQTKSPERSATLWAMCREIEMIKKVHADAAFIDWHYSTEDQTILGLGIEQGKAARKQGWDAALIYCWERWGQGSAESGKQTE